jgi:hypothetical protein
MMRSFTRHSAGNVALTFALLLTPLMGIVGFAIDTGEATMAKAGLLDLMDSAALTSVGRNAINPDTGTYSAAHSKELAEKYIYHYLHPNSVNPRLKDVTYEVVVSQSSQVINTTIRYSAKLDGLFSDLNIKEDLEIADVVKATSAPPTYLEIAIVVDGSSSMLIGADVADQQIMQNKMGCTFACHVDGPNGFGANAGRSLNVAHSHGAKVRFDVVKSALASIMDDADEQEVVNDQFAFSLYRFSNSLTKLKDVTADIGDMKSAIINMEPASRPQGGTNFHHSINQLNDDLSSSGTGQDIHNRKRIVLIFTDGIEDDVFYPTSPPGSYSWSPDPNYQYYAPQIIAGGERLQVFNPGLCNSFKSKNITVATLNTTYVVPAGTTDSRYVTIRDSFIPLIKQKMSQCASSDSLFFTANNSNEVKSASESMFSAVLAKARLEE